MKIKFKPCQRKRIRKFLSGFHGKERTDLYKIFTAIAYLVYTGCQWKMLPRYYPPPGTVLLFPQVERIDKARVFSAQSGGGRSPQDESKVMCLYYTSVSLVRADKGYCGVDSGLDGCIVECVKLNFGTAEFRPLSGRWVVERTNSWLENYRRLCRNYERYLSSALTMTYLAAILFMLRYC